jgi:hypothetical protein
MNVQELQAAESREVYVVVYFGRGNCGTLSVPEVTLFETREAAYQFYYNRAPSLNDLQIPARHQSGNKCQDAIIQCSGFSEDGDDGNYAKHPNGIAIYKRKVQI